ncbi:hypothetical protein NUM_06670 [Actinocatenispora comari]|uniref:Uncharacterized protein n=1 Tax=Actinocatenispora comari TaxID=2807577 RepID=A0A8J4AA77_9ACTN|nr:hypothetical protein NUM_06670 [Actinocatenispora comari]
MRDRTGHGTRLCAGGVPGRQCGHRGTCQRGDGLRARHTQGSCGGEPAGGIDADEKAAANAQRKKLPLGVPWVEPEDVAPPAVFLAPADACTVTGTSFAATAGDSATITV